MHSSKFKIIFYLSLIFFSQSCGLVSSRFEDYEEDTGPSEPASADTECGKAALALFTEQVEPAIDNKCGPNCHTPPGSGAPVRLLESGKDDANRTALFKYTGVSSTRLTGKISSNSHGGGDVSNILPDANVKAWTDKEAECAKASELQHH